MDEQQLEQKYKNSLATLDAAHQHGMPDLDYQKAVLNLKVSNQAQLIQSAEEGDLFKRGLTGGGQSAPATPQKLVLPSDGYWLDTLNLPKGPPKFPPLKNSDDTNPKKDIIPLYTISQSPANSQPAAKPSSTNDIVDKYVYDIPADQGGDTDDYNSSDIPIVGPDGAPDKKGVNPKTGRLNIGGYDLSDSDLCTLSNILYAGYSPKQTALIFIKLKQTDGNLSGDYLLSIGAAKTPNWFENLLGYNPNGYASLLNTGYSLGKDQLTFAEYDSQERQQRFNDAVGIVMMSAGNFGPNSIIENSVNSNKLDYEKPFDFSAWDKENGSDYSGENDQEGKQLRDGLELNSVEQGAPNTESLPSRFTGKFIKVENPDPAADALAERKGGESRIKFENDPLGKEFDVVNDQYICECKPALRRLNTRVRIQMKEAFQAAKETGREVYYHFEGQPGREVIDKLHEYSARYRVKVVIDTEPLFP